MKSERNLNVYMLMHFSLSININAVMEIYMYNYTVDLYSNHNPPLEVLQLPACTIQYMLSGWLCNSLVFPKPAIIWERFVGFPIAVIGSALTNIGTNRMDGKVSKKLARSTNSPILWSALCSAALCDCFYCWRLKGGGLRSPDTQMNAKFEQN